MRVKSRKGTGKVQMKYGFIGAGNMGGAILRGALTGGMIRAAETGVFGVNREKLALTEKELGIVPYTDLAEITRACRILIFGFKPQKFDESVPKIAEAYTPDKVVVSMAAGISIAYLEKYLGSSAKIVRIMPNTPAFVGEGMTSVSRNAHVTDEEMAGVLALFESIGRAAEVPEEMIHTVIGVSGSSPAFTYMYIDALAKEAEAGGMEREKALLFAAQAVLGAAKMVLETGETPEQLRKNVCSPGGTTIEGVEKLEELHFEEVAAAGARAAVEKSRRMTK